jgi:AcrR family transcriptional regulator
MIDSWLGVEPSSSIILESDRIEKGRTSTNTDSVVNSENSKIGSSSSDGRKRRSTNTKLRIVDALLDLVNEGDYHPTARQIAVRAGVSERSVFQHFNDLNELHTAVGQRQFDRLQKFRQPIPQSANFDKRLKIYVNQRANVLEAVTPIRRALMIVEPSSTSLMQLRQTFHQMNIDHILESFTVELETVEANHRMLMIDAVEAVSSWHNWEAIRFQGNSVARAKKIVELIIRSLFETALK